MAAKNRRQLPHREHVARRNGGTSSGKHANGVPPGSIGEYLEADLRSDGIIRQTLDGYSGGRK